MRALFLSAAAIAACAVPVSAANAGVLTFGGPLALNCFQAAEKGDTSRSAFDACDRALQVEPLSDQDRAATLVNRGILHMSKGHYAMADSNYDAAIELHSAMTDAWLNKAFLRLRQGAGREALPLLDKAIALGPRREAMAFFARGLAWEQTGEVRAAYADLRRAHDLEPGWALPAQQLARYQVRNR